MRPRTLYNRNGWACIFCWPLPPFGWFKFSDGFAVHLGPLLIDRWEAK